MADSFMEQEAAGEHGTDYVEVDPSGRYGRYKKVLGKGAFKTVYWAFDELEGMEVAWNQVKIGDILQQSDVLERLYSEVYLLKTLKHKNIIKYYNSWIDTKNNNINIITEIFTSGTLRQYRRRHKHVSIKAIKNWSRHILEGLVYLHSHDPPIIHRDLKCDNIFVNGSRGEVKIGDLGLAAILHHADAARSVIGTPEFMAPEFYEEEYNELVDIYSFGMSLLEMITSEYPYSECASVVEIYKRVTTGRKPAALDKVKDPSVRQFVEKCLETASRRLSARELLMDPFLQDEGNNKSMEYIRHISQFHSLGHNLKECENIPDEANGGRSYPKVSPALNHRLSDRGNLKIVEDLKLPFHSNAMIGAIMHQESVEVPNNHGLQNYIETESRTSSVEEEGLRNPDFRVKCTSKDSNTIFLRLRIGDSEGCARNIHFPFDIEADTAMIVASEMVAELNLPNQDVTTIAEMIDAEIEALVPEWKPRASFEDNSNDHNYSVVVDNPSDLPSVHSNTSHAFVLRRLPSGRKYWLQSPVSIREKSASELARGNASARFQDLMHGRVDKATYPQSCTNSTEDQSDEINIFRESICQGEGNNQLDKIDRFKFPGHSKRIDFNENLLAISQDGSHSHPEIVTDTVTGTRFLIDPLLENDRRITHELEKLALQQQHEREALKLKHEQAVQDLKNRLSQKGCTVTSSRNALSETCESPCKLSVGSSASYRDGNKSERISFVEIASVSARFKTICDPEVDCGTSYGDNCISTHIFGVQTLSPNCSSSSPSQINVSSKTQEQLPCKSKDSMVTEQLLGPKFEGCDIKSSSIAEETDPDGKSSKPVTVDMSKRNGLALRSKELSEQGKYVDYTEENMTSSNPLSRRDSFVAHFSNKSSLQKFQNTTPIAMKERGYEDVCKDIVVETKMNGLTFGLASRDKSNPQYVASSENEIPAEDTRQPASVKSTRHLVASSLEESFRKEKESWKPDKSAAEKYIKQDTRSLHCELIVKALKRCIPTFIKNSFGVDKHGNCDSNLEFYKNDLFCTVKPSSGPGDLKDSYQGSSKARSRNLSKQRGKR